MPHRNLPLHSRIEKHLGDSSTYKELNSNLTQAIKNDFLSTLDHLHKTHRLDDKTRHLLTRPNPARAPLFYGLPKVHKSNMPLWPIVSYVIAPPINFQTISPTSYNLLWRYSPNPSRTANTFYSSLNPSHRVAPVILEINSSIFKYNFKYILSYSSM